MGSAAVLRIGVRACVLGLPPLGCHLVFRALWAAASTPGRQQVVLGQLDRLKSDGRSLYHLQQLI